MSTSQLTTLNARGLNCPLPILRTKKQISAMRDGEILQIIATDPGSVKDLQAFCKQTGNILLESREENGEFIFQIRKISKTGVTS